MSSSVFIEQQAIEARARMKMRSRSERDIEEIAPEEIAAPKAVYDADCKLFEFAREAWHVLEPTTPYVDNWHIHAISEHLEACTRREIRKLIINIPPRCEKSLLTCVFWFAWSWSWQPSSRWLYSSYADTLSVRDSIKCRDLVLSQWYQAQYGLRFKLKGDVNRQNRFENDKTGLRISTGVEGLGVGEGGDYIIVDDPHKTQEAESAAQIAKTCTWWNETMSTRGNNPSTVVHLIIMQRIAETDLTGDVIAKELGYTHLCLPMRYESNHPTASTPARPTPVIIDGKPFSDPRDAANGGHGDGELLWPDRMTEDAVDTLEASLLDFGTAGQLQQRPTVRGGQFLKENWFEIIQELPEDVDFVRYWDKAGSDEKGDYTAGLLMARRRSRPRHFIIVDLKHEQLSVHGREMLIRNTVMQDMATWGRGDPGVVRQYIEREGGSAGKDMATLEIEDLAGFVVYSDSPSGDKVTRARPLANQAEAGNVKILNRPFAKVVLDEFGKFRENMTHKHDDIVDAASGALNKLSKLDAGPELPRSQSSSLFRPKRRR